MTKKEINKYKEKLKENIEESFRYSAIEDQKVFALSIQALVTLESFELKGLYTTEETPSK